MCFKEICSDDIEYFLMAEGRFKVENLENSVTSFSVPLVEIRFLLT